MSKTAMIHIRVEPEKAQKIKHWADKEGLRGSSDVVRDAIDLYLENEQGHLKRVARNRRSQTSRLNLEALS